ncbi:hypothetical protein RYX36_009984 [Vicia faba]
MGRLPSKGKGISSSSLPYKRTTPSWLKISSQDVDETICKFAKKRLTPSQIVLFFGDYVEADEDDDIPYANIIKRIIENITKPQEKATQERDKEVVNMDEDAETDKEPVVNEECM